MKWFWVLGFASLAFAETSPKTSLPWDIGSKVVAQKRMVGPADTPLNMPTDCAVSPDGHLYVLDGVNHRVVVYDGGGTYQNQFGSPGREPGQFSFPLGITVATDGKVYVADSGNSRFQVFSSSGEFLEAVPIPKASMNSRPDPSDVAVDPRLQQLYIVDNDNHRLHVYNLQTHNFTAVWGSPGQGRRQFRYPFLMDLSEQGYLFVVEPINTRIQVLNAQGKFVNFVGQWGVQKGQLFRPKGVAVVGQQLYVTDSYLGRIQMFDVRGEYLSILSDSSGRPIVLTTPTGIAADIHRKRLYVVELKANQVCRLDME